LTNLQVLDLSSNQLSQVPVELGQLTSLQQLDLSSNQLSQVPVELGQLTNLQQLDLNSNQLSQVPVELGQLTNLQVLDLRSNQLSQVPVELGQLTNLQVLDLRSNQLSQVPVELGQLTNLQQLYIDDNPSLLTLPPEIVVRGTRAMLTFLRELQEKSVTRYEAKLLVVGEGGTGKSSLLRALRNETFAPDLTTTHGIEVATLELAHSSQAHVKIILNTWDFGGQQIYHATHQFFLTERSLYLVAWNARLGVEQGKLHYWLDTIKALAPEAPVLLVATHIDERAPDLNYQSYEEEYPQLIGHVSVSNAKGIGITKLKAAITEQALQLPLMGQLWPQKWLAVCRRETGTPRL
jgi:small GTP-binding protein